MVNLSHRKLIRTGKSYAITIPKDIVNQYKENGKEEVLVAIFEYSELPSAKDVLKWVVN